MRPDRRLMRAAYNGRGDIIKKALADGADPNVEHSVVVGVRPLHRIVLYRSQSALNGLRLLIAAGADVNAKSSGGDTPLGLALEWKNIKGAAILRDAGAVE